MHPKTPIHTDTKIDTIPIKKFSLFTCLSACFIPNCVHFCLVKSTGIVVVQNVSMRYCEALRDDCSEGLSRLSMYNSTVFCTLVYDRTFVDPKRKVLINLGMGSKYSAADIIIAQTLPSCVYL